MTNDEQLLPGDLQAVPALICGGGPDTANAGIGAASATAGTAQAMALVTVRRLTPFDCSTSDMIGRSSGLSHRPHPQKTAVEHVGPGKLRRARELSHSRRAGERPI